MKVYVLHRNFMSLRLCLRHNFKHPFCQPLYPDGCIRIFNNLINTCQMAVLMGLLVQNHVKITCRHPTFFRLTDFHMETLKRHAIQHRQQPVSVSP